MTADFLPSPTPNLRTIWLLRLLLGVLFLFGSEVLLWIDPPGRAVTDWLLLIPGYIALGALALDLAARYRARSIYELMTIAAVYGLLNGLLLNPETSFSDFPRTLVTRIVGAHTLLGLQMLGVFRVLTAGHKRRWIYLLLGFGVWVGFYWGIWVRWSPSLTDWLDAEVSLVTMFAWAGGVLGVAGIVLYIVGTQHAASLPTESGDDSGTRAMQIRDLRLSPLSWLGVLTVIIVLFVVQALREAYADYGVVLVILGIVGLCLVILWFQRGEKSRTVLDHSIPPTPLGWRWIGAAVTVFAAITVVAYSLPLVTIEGYNQLSVMEYGFAAVGFLWFPLIAGVIGGRALERQTRKLNL